MELPFCPRTKLLYPNEDVVETKLQTVEFPTQKEYARLK